MGWEEHINRKNRIKSVIEGYQYIKGIHSQFIANFKKSVNSNNEYNLTIKAEDETQVTLTVLDDVINISFGIVVDDRTVYGKLIFDRGTAENQEHIFTLFFDDQGRIKHSPKTEQFIQSLHDKQVADFVLTLLLDRYINLPRFRAGEEASDG